MTHKSLCSGCSFQSLTAVKTNIESAIFHYCQLLCLLKPECLILHLIPLPLFALGECKYNFQAWGECDLVTGKKNRTGVLKRALMDATCATTVTATKPCGKMPKTKLQGNLRNHWNRHWTCWACWQWEFPRVMLTSHICTLWLNPSSVTQSLHHCLNDELQLEACENVL